MAVGNYDANGIWHYGESDNISPFSTLLNKLADSASSAVTSDRARIATLEAGSLSGLIPVKPSTVAVGSGSAAISAKGTVTFTGASTVSLNGVFTTAYSHYMVVFSEDSSTATGNPFYCRFRTAGVDNTNANYYWGGTFTRISGVQGAHAGNGSSVLQLGYIHTSPFTSGVLYITNPQKAIFTTFDFSFFGQDSTGALSTIAAGTFNLNTQFDGITFFPSAGNMTGSVTIYGFNA